MGELSFRAQAETRDGAQGPWRGVWRRWGAQGWWGVVRRTWWSPPGPDVHCIHSPQGTPAAGTVSPNLNKDAISHCQDETQKREKRTQRERQSGRLAVITARQPFLGQRREGLFRRWPASEVNSKSGCLCNKRAPVGSHPPPKAVPPSTTLRAPHWRLEEQVEWPGEWSRGSKQHH